VALTAAAKALIEAGAYVVVTGRRQTELDRAKQLLGKNATAVLGSADKCD
jgi:NADP-dependent 3-hydroxy acid dehydrogenase YdfG